MGRHSYDYDYDNVVVKVTRLGEISTFGLLFKGPGGFFVGKIWLVVCIFESL
jgi:hypothetical protein